MKKSKKYNIGLFWKGKKQPLSVRLKNSLSLKKAYLEGRHKKVWSGKHFSKEHKEKLKRSNIKTWKNKELINKHKKIMKKRWKNKKERKKHSKIMKKVYENQELRAKIALKLIKIKRNLEEIKKAKQKAKEIWKQKPYLKERCKKALELYLLNYNLKKLLGKKENIERLKTLSGYVVKSKYEKNLANFLYLNKINAKYERYALFFPEMFCVPDFYLPKFNVFIEVYGQHPDAERKKRKKIKVYKKYKVPVIELTPSEFRNLNYFVISEIKSKEMIKKARNFNLKIWTNPLNNEITKEFKRKNPSLFKEYLNSLVKNKL
ncbi:MAG: hypothetical protein QW117_01135 [Candidatus Pacearchaeota archaeon]